MTPDDPKPYADRGMTSFMSARYEEALDYYDRASSLGLDAAWLMMRRGYAQRALGNHEAAFTTFNRAVELAPDAAAYAARALASLRLGGAQDARADIDRAIEAKPEFAEWWVYRSLFDWHLHDKEQAADDAARAATLDLRTALVHDEQCLLVLWRGELPWAQDFYRWADERGLDAALVALGRADALRINDEHALAVAEYDRALAINLTPSVMLSRARSHAALGDNARAAADYRQMLTLTNEPHLVQPARDELARVEGTATEHDHA